MRLVGLISLVVAVAELLAPAAAAEPQHGNFGNESIRVGQEQREYRLVVPRSVDLKQPAPLVFAFHGLAIDSKDLMPVYTKLNDTAEKHRFILVYPNAQDHNWALTPGKMLKDLEFFDVLVKKLTTDYQIDRDRIYLVGMSNGGYFAHFVGKHRSQEVAAVVSHSGALGVQTLPGIRAERKFPVMIIHGDKDSIIPVDVARANRDKYQKEGHEVLYVEVPGLNHLWAGGDINEQIWKFFADHPLAKK